jgi:thioredoxin 1
MSENVVELTDASFDEILNSSDVPVLVDFWAPWCGPCKMLAPVLDDIASEYGDKLKVCKVDTDEHRDAAVEYAISAIPTIILFKGGQIEKKWVGMTTKQDITEAIDAL